MLVLSLGLEGGRVKRSYQLLTVLLDLGLQLLILNDALGDLVLQINVL